MENNDVGNTVPLMAEHEGLQVAVTEVEVDNRLENGGGGGPGEHEGAMVVAVANGGAEGGFSEKRKRGRPRKQLGEIRQELRLVAVEENSGGPQKRGRGRPRGSGKWQTLANSFGKPNNFFLIFFMTKVTYYSYGGGGRSCYFRFGSRVSTFKFDRVLIYTRDRTRDTNIISNTLFVYEYIKCIRYLLCVCTL